MKIKDIAQMAGVSVATVSRVINDDPKVSAPSRQKVQEIIKRTGYVPNFLGRNLRVSKTQKILVLLPTLANPFYSRILTGIEDTAAKYHYNVFVGVTHQNAKIENEYMNMLTTKQVDGTISFLSHVDKDTLTGWAEKFPLVQCCEYTPGARLSYVCIDNEQAAFEAVSHLISLGHRRIGAITGQLYFASETLRSRGYRRALEEAKIAVRKEYSVPADYTYESGQEACRRLLELDDPPTAIFTFGDTIAIGAINHLRSIGKAAGKDVAVMGFDNISVTAMFNPSISTVAQPRYDLGSTAVELLMEKINDLSVKNKGILMPHELILRESTGTQLK